MLASPNLRVYTVFELLNINDAYSYVYKYPHNKIMFRPLSQT